MKTFVVDASVAVKWTVPEEFTTQALALLRGAGTIHAPAHWLGEAANTLWAMFAVRRELSRETMIARVRWLGRVKVRTTPVADLLPAAAEISADLNMVVYDSLYLALAAERKLPFVTADRRLVARTVGSEHAGRTHWLGDIG